jgi:hypothetical protein
MKKASFKSALAVFALLVALGSLSSCNRGYGCPDNFSMNTKVISVVDQAVNLIADYD